MSAGSAQLLSAAQPASVILVRLRSSSFLLELREHSRRRRRRACRLARWPLLARDGDIARSSSRGAAAIAAICPLSGAWQRLVRSVAVAAAVGLATHRVCHRGSFVTPALPIEGLRGG